MSELDTNDDFAKMFLRISLIICEMFIGLRSRTLVKEIQGNIASWFTSRIK